MVNSIQSSIGSITLRENVYGTAGLGVREDLFLPSFVGFTIVERELLELADVASGDEAHSVRLPL